MPFFANLPRFEPETDDSTSMKAANDCLRKYFYRFILGRVPPKSKYQTVFDFGSAIHKFREVLEVEYTFNKLSKAEAFEKALLAVKDMPLTPGVGKYEFYNRQRLLESCTKSFNWWDNEKTKGQIEVLAVEQPFSILMPNGRYISGRADQIIKWNGKIWGRDFKTTSKELKYFEATLDPNDQPIRYIFAESKLHFGEDAIENGKQIQGIIFEVLQNTADTKTKKGKHGEIANITITKNNYQLKKWLQEQEFMGKVLKMAKEEDIWPMQSHNCSFCDYHSVCKKPSEASMEYELKANFKLSPWDPTKVEQVTFNET